MTNEEIQEIVAKADDEYDRLKDRVHEQYDEIERLKDLCNKYEEEHKTTFIEWKKAINIIKEVREYIIICKNSNLVFSNIMYKELLEILEGENNE